MAYGEVLETSARARLTARVTLLVGGAVYASWQVMHKLMMPDAIDPIGERLAFFALTVILVGLSCHPRLTRHLVAMGYGVVAAGTAHYFSVVARNDIATPYLIGVFVTLGAVTALLVTVRAIAVYYGYVLVLALIVAALAPNASTATRLDLVVGTFTVQLGFAATAWRNVTMREVSDKLERANREVKQLRGLLPICMHCNKIRGDDGGWQNMELFVESHSDAAFTHSLCADCEQLHYSSG
ncbi:MAG TPA: hypothetical protein VFH73_14230 [Polyangia bacterium]|jgi:hypothetical protein|nr:hypothetical protein [Polyangia bacterium]